MEPARGITFDPAVFDTYPNTLQLLTFGSPLLESLLVRVPLLRDGEATGGNVLRLAVDGPLRRVAYYVLGTDGRPRRLDRLVDMRRALAAVARGREWSEDETEAARQDLRALAESEWESISQGQQQLDQARRSALEARAARLLGPRCIIRNANSSAGATNR